MKRFLVIVVMVLVGTVVFATGSNEAAGGMSGDPASVTWYYPGNYPQADQDEVFAAFNAMSEAAININVDFKPVGWGDYNQRMQVIIASGEEFDLCFTANWMNNYLQNVAKGAFVPLNDLLSEHAPTLFETVPDKIWDATKVNGNIYGFINYQISAMTSGLSFPQEFVDKYDFDYQSVSRLEDLEPYLAAVKAGEPDDIFPMGMANFPGRNIGHVNAYLGFEEIGGRAIPGVILDNDPNLRVVNQFETDRFRDWIELTRDWYLKGYIREDAIAINDMNPNLSAAKVGVSFVGNYKPGGDAESSARFGFTVVESPISESLLITSSIISTMHAISVTSENAVSATQLMEYLNTDVDAYNLIGMGVEGQHYNKVEANRVELVPDSGYAPSTLWLHASTFNAYLLPGQPDDVWERTRNLNLNANASPLLGFSFNPEPIQSELAQISSVLDEYLPALELGTVDPDEFLPIFLERLDGAGAQRIVDEMQSQIDVWKAGN